MEYHVLASGSKGNSTFIVEKTTGILIDCGISKKQLVYRLKEIGYTIDDIDYVLLTRAMSAACAGRGLMMRMRVGAHQ